jgi:hypothetical protein
MKIAINDDNYGRVIKTEGAFNVYTITIAHKDFFWGESEDTFVLNRENALRLQEGIRLWLKEHPV